MFTGINNSMATMHLLSDAKSRSISPENCTGEKGRGGMAEEGTGKRPGRDLGKGWKISPSVEMPPKTEFLLGEIEGPGAIEHIWMTFGSSAERKTVWHDMIFRIYWDGQEYPSVEVPAGDFFLNGWNVFAPTVSLPICANPASGFNSYFTMPFRKKARLTMENRREEPIVIYYQIDYVLAEVDEDSAYFCASFRRSDPTADGIHTIVDGIRGKGQYVGTYLAWQVNNNNWWGEGEVKFYMDGDTDYPTYCGTGTEDYFCGAYNFDVQGHYMEFCTPYTGLNQVIRPDGLYSANTRFGMYRFHITDPLRFEKDLRVTVQDLGWRDGGRYLVQKSTISSVAYWYQTLPTAPFPALGTKDGIEVI